jgi:hypothetical protein
MVDIPENENTFIKHQDLFLKRINHYFRRDNFTIPNFFLRVFTNNPDIIKAYPKYLQFSQKIRLCEHKFSAFHYHLRNYIRLEKKYIRKNKAFLKEVPIPKLTFAGATYDLVFEFEAFIIQFRSCLDFLAQAISIIFNQNIFSWRDLQKILMNNSNRGNKILANKLLKLIGENEWINEFLSESDRVSDRDKVVHYGILNLGTLNVIKMGDNKYVAIKLKNKNEILKKYMETRTKKLEKLIEYIIDILFEEKFVLHSPTSSY